MDDRQSGASLGEYENDVTNALSGLVECDVIQRIWRRDHTVWQDDPTEITDRLGWLAVTDAMRDRLSELEAFSREIRDDGFKHIVLLGMGGSSLGPEVLKQTFGSAAGYPDLIVLDSTVPARIHAVTATVDPAHTLFLISSKSGGTIEPLSLEIYFRTLVEQAVGRDRANRSFVAITDPGTQLAVRAEHGEFRHAFLNAPDIGGRYSVLSFFGLVPAALMGMDIATLIDRADHMRGECSSSEYAADNSGAWLGTVMGTMALQGRDKLTLITSPAIAGFGLWVEQLIAESTGKDGKGIIPVAGEALVDTAYYGSDRLFICLRLDEDNNTALDKFVERLRGVGQPVLTLELRDRYDLGAEFFRWEFATAVAGAILGINPFDQPNVKQAKEATDSVLREYEASGVLPQITTISSLNELLESAGDGSYLAIMAYLEQNPLADESIADLRRMLTERYYIPTTLGYGPRYLHSTGQLHKGGPGTGLFLQITAKHDNDIPIPGRPYSFGVLADAQAMGDLRALQSTGREVVGIRLEEASQMAISKTISEMV